MKSNLKKIVIILLIILAITACNKDQKEKKNYIAFDHVERIITQTIDYKEGNTALEGYLAYDPSVKGKRPAILLAHAWKGLDDYAKRRTQQLAKMGYIVFALDIYGKGVHAKDHKEAAQLSGIYTNDRKLMRARVRAGLEVLSKHKLTDTSRIAAVGYCFGGAAVLELARSGADIKGTVTFHGNLTNPHPEDAKNIKGKVLVLHGAADTFVSPKVVASFRKEMDKAKVDWSMKSYKGAVHAFTVREAGTDTSTGLAYNETADKESWKEMTSFLKVLFK
ncbi:MAG: dienelactone hydrolase [bacterium]|nr:MAG: dienelactone hydrolase [bacterium]